MVIAIIRWWWGYDFFMCALFIIVLKVTLFLLSFSKSWNKNKPCSEMTMFFAQDHVSKLLQRQLWLLHLWVFRFIFNSDLAESCIFQKRVINSACFIYKCNERRAICRRLYLITSWFSFFIFIMISRNIFLFLRWHVVSVILFWIRSIMCTFPS